jgi:NAD dependent epimerase/dehydratase family enzyme
MTSKVVIAGGSGAIGKRLVTSLTEKCEVVVLTRRPDPDADVRQVFWDGETVGDWARELDSPDTAVLNLAGKLVDCRPTASPTPNHGVILRTAIVLDPHSAALKRLVALTRLGLGGRVAGGRQSPRTSRHRCCRGPSSRSPN